MNTLLFTADDVLPSGLISIRDDRLKHLIEVLNVQVGQQLKTGELNGKLGRATVLTLDSTEATLTVELTEEPPSKLPLCLILALPRPKMLRRILRASAELGVADLHLINSYRVEKSYWQTPALKTHTMRGYFIQGLEQACDTMLPTVTLHPRFKPFVEDTLPSLIGQKQAILAQPGDHPPCPHDTGTDTVLVVGPEGGFIPYEVEKLQQAGCGPVSLGPRILRVENAITYLIGRLF